jgi:hypothetical protein
MKKISLNILGIITFNCISISPIWAKIYLQNNYGQGIAYKERLQTGSDVYEKTPKILGNGGSVEIADPKEVQGRHSLYISPSNNINWWDISHVYDQIHKEYKSHVGYDPIIMIQPGSNIFGRWNIDIEWVEEEKGTKMGPMIIKEERKVLKNF